MEMKTLDFGTTLAGEKTKLYIFSNDSKMAMAVSDYGATMVSVLVPDRDGNLCDVVLGYDDVSGYENGGLFLGATVGRNANRIGKAVFSIDGKQYQVADNENGNNLHSGPDFYSKRCWEIKEIKENSITFVLLSPDGDQGYPGNLEMSVTYTLTDDNQVQIAYEGVADADTIVNMTNHSYFNLNGHASGSILEQQVRIDADYFTRTDAASIPTGELVEVMGTPMDFKVLKPVGKEISEKYEALVLGQGYDHNWVLNNQGEYAKVAEMVSDVSGIHMDVFTDLPGIQLYTGNFIDAEKGRGNVSYQRRQALCFETQYFPDAVNQKSFASPILKAGERYQTRTSYQFKND